MWQVKPDGLPQQARLCVGLTGCCGWVSLFKRLMAAGDLCSLNRCTKSLWAILGVSSSLSLLKWVVLLTGLKQRVWKQIHTEPPKWRNVLGTNHGPTKDGHRIETWRPFIRMGTAQWRRATSRTELLPHRWNLATPLLPLQCKYQGNFSNFAAHFCLFSIDLLGSVQCSDSLRLDAASPIHSPTGRDQGPPRPLINRLSKGCTLICSVILSICLSISRAPRSIN